MHPMNTFKDCTFIADDYGAIEVGGSEDDESCVIQDCTFAEGAPEYVITVDDLS